MSIDLADLSGFVGTHMIYTYANGWQYELYVKNSGTVDYRIHGGMVAGRWVKGQHVDLVRLDEDLYRISWTEPTGTSVSVNAMPARRRLHTVIFFPRWVHLHPERTVCFQNEHLDEMLAYRERGPTYPIDVVSEWGTITFLENRGPDDESVISVAPADLPPGYTERTDPVSARLAAG
ncbi:phenolic acid decarboxylase [Amycolatopsis arida]|uniref:Phenolic acid decarboxylase n=1 Tax=Amycolatopsis arida TaxID=587909 RepID=A0A1I6AWN7_9PSEU|nr:phenolic acid decarboxylase [Amycolatopsis arida]TDX85379.1 phenolic acid decarboxylase [Amycolatopsis arida]SFQ73094.1 phenolic acid decarboxylase [Amycolatopsis arida]